MMQVATKENGKCGLLKTGLGEITKAFATQHNARC
jgi:hypothetical protein